MITNNDIFKDVVIINTSTENNYKSIMNLKNDYKKINFNNLYKQLIFNAVELGLLYNIEETKFNLIGFYDCTLDLLGNLGDYPTNTWDLNPEQLEKEVFENTCFKIISSQLNDLLIKIK